QRYLKFVEFRDLHALSWRRAVVLGMISPSLSGLDYNDRFPALKTPGYFHSGPPGRCHDVRSGATGLTLPTISATTFRVADPYDQDTRVALARNPGLEDMIPTG